MKKDSSIIIFNQKQVRRTWDVEKELWYFSVVDVIEILTDTKRPRKYWNDLKQKLSEEGSQLSEKIGQLEFLDLFFRDLKYNSNVFKNGTVRVCPQ